MGVATHPPSWRSPFCVKKKFGALALKPMAAHTSLVVPPPKYPRACASAFAFAPLRACSRARSSRSSRASVFAAFSCARRVARSRSTCRRACAEHKASVAGRRDPSWLVLAARRSLGQPEPEPSVPESDLAEACVPHRFHHSSAPSALRPPPPMPSRGLPPWRTGGRNRRCGRCQRQTPP